MELMTCPEGHTAQQKHTYGALRVRESKTES